MYVDFKQIGGRIQRARRQRGMTQEQMAERIGVSVGYVSQIERGYSKVSLDRLSEIAVELGCDMGELVSGTAPAKGDYLQGELLDKYARLDHRQRRIVLECMDVLLRHQGEEK